MMVTEKESPIPSTSTAGINKDDPDEEANIKHPFNSPKKEYYRFVLGQKTQHMIAFFLM